MAIPESGKTKPQISAQSEDTATKAKDADHKYCVRNALEKIISDR